VGLLRWVREKISGLAFRHLERKGRSIQHPTSRLNRSSKTPTQNQKETGETASVQNEKSRLAMSPRKGRKGEEMALHRQQRGGGHIEGKDPAKSSKGDLHAVIRKEEGENRPEQNRPNREKKNSLRVAKKK